MVRDERVPRGYVGKGDRIPITLRAVTPPVEHDEDNRTLGHEIEIKGIEPGRLPNSRRQKSKIPGRWRAGRLSWRHGRAGKGTMGRVRGDCRGRARYFAVLSAGQSGPDRAVCGDCPGTRAVGWRVVERVWRQSRGPAAFRAAIQPGRVPPRGERRRELARL